MDDRFNFRIGDKKTHAIPLDEELFNFMVSLLQANDGGTYEFDPENEVFKEMQIGDYISLLKKPNYDERMMLEIEDMNMFPIDQAYQAMLARSDDAIYQAMCKLFYEQFIGKNQMATMSTRIIYDKTKKRSLGRY